MPATSMAARPMNGRSPPRARTGSSCSTSITPSINWHRRRHGPREDRSCRDAVYPSRRQSRGRVQGHVDLGLLRPDHAATQPARGQRLGRRLSHRAALGRQSHHHPQLGPAQDPPAERQHDALCRSRARLRPGAGQTQAMSDWQIDKPQAGYYATRLVRNGPLVAVHIWYGAPPDPEDPRKLLDRSHRWQCLVDGCEADPWETWPRVAGRTITEGEYRRLLGAKK